MAKGTKVIYNSIRQKVDEMPEGIDRAVLAVLGFHVGVENAIHKDGLILQVEHMGVVNASERNVRKTITELRKQGYLIAGNSSEAGGYYLCKDLFEYEQFREGEYMARVRDILETVKLMDVSAQHQFGDAQQMGLGF